MNGDARGRAPALLVEFFDCGIGKQLGARRRHGLVNESIDDAGADQRRERGLRVAIAGDHDHEIGKLPLDLRR